MSEYRILEGDCLDVLATLPERSVQTCITSPPYFGLRAYGGGDAEIGVEETPEQYVANLVAVFREVRRVLRDDGTVWLNLGDSYAGSGRGPTGENGIGQQETRQGFHSPTVRAIENVKPKDLLGIPWMVAFALRADGWYLRSEVIWAKRNCMPESVQDRPTRAHEQIFLLSKERTYFYDADAVREDDVGADHPRNILHKPEPSGGLMPAHNGIRKAEGRDGMGRNRRSVWHVATQPFPGAHFATFPPKLIEPCVLAGSSPQACAECGAPWERVVERVSVRDKSALLAGGKMETLRDSGARRDGLSTSNSHNGACTPDVHTVGWQPTCAHSDGSARCTILDPFSGAGTTGVVALRHDRDFIGIELNASYAQMSRDRIYDDGPLLNTMLGEDAA